MAFEFDIAVNDSKWKRVNRRMINWQEKRK